MPVILDHAGIAVADLDTVLAQYARLGFAPTVPRELTRLEDGRAVPLGQRSAHAVFGDSYLEFTSVGASPAAHHLDAYAGRGDGLRILALRDDDLATAWQRVSDRGGEPTAITVAAREVDHGPGSAAGTARFEWFAVAPAASPEGLTCFMRHLTPGLVFQPAVQRHPNGVLGLDAVWIVAPDPAAAAQRYARLAGGRPEPGPTGWRVWLERGRLELVDAAAFRRRFPGAAAPLAMCFAGVTLRVADMAVLRDVLARGGADWRADGPTAAWVPPAAAGGALVEFVA